MLLIERQTPWGRSRGLGRVMVVLALMLVATPVWAHHGGGIGGASGPINGFSADTLSQGTWSLDVRFQSVQFFELSDDELLNLAAIGLDAHSVRLEAHVFTTLAYGYSDRLTFAVTLPYRHVSGVRAVESFYDEEEDAFFDEVVELGDSGGLCDLTLLAYYKLWTSDDEAKTLTLLGGVTAPTGATNRRTLLGDQFEAEHQPGAGAWNPLLGLAGSQVAERLSLHASVLYVFNSTGAQDTALGDVFRYDAAAVYRLGHFHAGHGHSHGGSPMAARTSGSDSPLQLVGYHPEEDHGGGAAAPSSSTSGGEMGGDEDDDDGNPWGLDLVLELNGISVGQNRIGGAIEDASGGNVVYLSPGLRLIREDRWSIYSSAGIPIIQDQNPGEHRVNVRYVIGLTGQF